MGKLQPHEPMKSGRRVDNSVLTVPQKHISQHFELASQEDDSSMRWRRFLVPVVLASFWCLMPV